jgi:hypothetical protein
MPELDLDGLSRLAAMISDLGGEGDCVGFTPNKVHSLYTDFEAQGPKIGIVRPYSYLLVHIVGIGVA